MEKEQYEVALYRIRSIEFFMIYFLEQLYSL